MTNKTRKVRCPEEKTVTKLTKFWKRYSKKWIARNFLKQEMEHYHDK